MFEMSRSDVSDVTLKYCTHRLPQQKAMALSELSHDEQELLCLLLCNVLHPGLAVALGTVSGELRAAAREPLRRLKTDHHVATALWRKLGYRVCKQECKGLREAPRIWSEMQGLSSDDMALLGTLGSMLPALQELVLKEPTASPDGVQRLAEKLGAGALPAVDSLRLYDFHVGDAGASALAAALCRGAMPRLKVLKLSCTKISDAGLVALAPALRRLPALVSLNLNGNPFGDEGLGALVAPPPPSSAGAPPPTKGKLAMLKSLSLRHTQISEAGCFSMALAMENHDPLPALERLELDDGVLQLYGSYTGRHIPQP